MTGGSSQLATGASSPSPQLLALIEQARLQKALITSDYDPIEMRKIVVLPSALPEAPGTIDAGEFVIECRGTKTANRVLVAAAGGGFCFPANDMHRVFLDRLANHVGAQVFLVHHRLAPEHPFPAPLDDVMRALDLAFDAEGAERVDCIGDSSAGGLMLSALMARRDAKLPLPSSCILMSPFTDLATTGLSCVTNREADPSFGVEALIHKTHHYLQGANPTDAAASPYWGDVSGLPPLLMFAGDTEIMLDDTRRFAAKVREAQGVVIERIFEAAPHVWPIYPDLPEADAAIDEMIRFLAEKRI